MAAGLVFLLCVLFSGLHCSAFPSDLQILAGGENSYGKLAAGYLGDREYYIDITDRVKNASGTATPIQFVTEMDSSSMLFDNGSVAVAGLATWDHVTQSDWVSTSRWVPLVESSEWNYTIPFSKLWSSFYTTFAYSNATKALYAWGTNDFAGGWIDPTLDVYVYRPVRIGTRGGSFPVQVDDVLHVTGQYIAGTFALLSPGNVYYWGFGYPAYLGYGPISPSPLPGTLAASVNFTHVCGQYRNIVLFSQDTGKFYWWGLHTELSQTSYTDVVEFPSRTGDFANATIASLACTQTAVLALTTTGDVWAFGANLYGEFGNGEWSLGFVQPSAAVKVPFPMPVNQLIDNRDFGLLALTEEYSYAWGGDAYFFSGISGSGGTHLTPLILTFSGNPIKNATRVAAMSSVFLVVPRQTGDTPAPTPQPATIVDDTITILALGIVFSIVCVYTLAVVVFF